MNNLNNLNLSQDKINALLGLASQKLGKTPEQLKAELEGGNAENLIQNLDPKAAKQLGGLMNNPKALEAVMNNDKVKTMLAGLLENQGK